MTKQSRRRSSESGAIAVLMALLLTVIMGFGALGFDVAYIRLARTEMKQATDAAAHAGMTVLRISKGNATLAASVAAKVAAKNTVLGNAVTLDESDIAFGVWDYDTSSFVAGSTPYNAVKIIGRKSDPSATAGTVKTTFGRMMGITAAQVAQTSYSAYRPRAMMFEMDITGSFLTASCAIDEAISADLAFLKAMYDAASAKDRIGMDVFTGKAAPFTPLQLIQEKYTDIRSDWKGDAVSALSASHESGIGVCTQDPEKTDASWSCGGSNTGWPNQAKLKSGVDNLKCWDSDVVHFNPPVTIKEVYGGTNIGAAIKLGRETLEAQGKTYEARSIVVFTDGGPLCCEQKGGGGLCPNGGHPCCADATTPGCTDNGTGACQCSAALIQFATDEANLAEAAGIDVFVLSFGGYAPWINFARGLARGRGFTLDTNDKNQLQTKLEEIANAIPVALVQ